jgi:hypothetical protein
MLDIYYTTVSVTSCPDDPDGLELAGSIDLNTHKSLSGLFGACEKMGIPIKYFDDSYIEPGQIARLLAAFNEHTALLPDNQTAREGYKIITTIFSKALKKNLGLATFSD